MTSTEQSPALAAVQRVACELEQKTDTDGVRIWWGAAAHVLKHIDRLAGPGPVPPHQHVDDHDPADWRSDCCACQNRVLRSARDRRDLFVDESCASCLAQRDQDRPYIVVEWAVRHPSGVVEEHIPESMAFRALKGHPDRELLRRERVVTPDVVSDYEVVTPS